MRAWTHRRILGWLPLLGVLMGAGVLGAIRDNHITTDIVWNHSFAAGLMEAKRSHKPLLLSFHTPGCGWCEKLDAETFTDPRIVEISRRFVCVYVDSEMDADVTRRFNVSDFPVTLIADPNGSPLLPISGYIPADRLVPALEKTLQALSP